MNEVKFQLNKPFVAKKTSESPEPKDFFKPTMTPVSENVGSESTEREAVYYEIAC